ncbi:MAG: hypothetical protein WCZ86_06220 [Desulfurivibrionaceae bacterium]
MKRFLLFGFDTHQPEGGWNDFIDSFDSVMAALSYCIKAPKNYKGKDNWQVIDSETWTEVEL